jgi:hypothetical protein
MASRWKTNEEGMERLRAADRLMPSGNTFRYVRYLDDFNGIAVTNIAVTNIWTDTAMSGSADRKRYVVHTNPKVIARCITMTTDPGDLVLDSTCGGGTTATSANSCAARRAERAGAGTAGDPRDGGASVQCGLSRALWSFSGALKGNAETDLGGTASP